MRHLVFGRKLGRDTNERKALLANLSNSLISKGQITTTLAKAKFAQGYVEKLITAAKSNKLATQRSLAPYLTSQDFLRLVSEIGPGFLERKGGYTRIIKLGSRLGDNAPMARLEILPYQKPQPKKSKVSKRLNAKSVARKSAAQKKGKVQISQVNSGPSVLQDEKRKA